MVFLDRFRRITSSDAFIPEVDGLRFFAIIPVMMLHVYKHYQRLHPDRLVEITNHPFDNILSFGGLGVEVFFVISGCILGMPFASHLLLGTRKVNIKRYFIRRLTRLEPPFILCILGIYFAYLLVLKSDVTGFEAGHFWATITYTHNFIYGAWSTINPVTWSLEAEVQFYIFAPLLASLFFIRKKIHRRLILVGIIVAWTMMRSFFHPVFVTCRLDGSALYHICLFLLGFLFADVFLTDLKKIPKNYYWDAVCVLSIIGIYQFAWKHLYPFQHLLFLASIFLFFVSVFKSVFWNRFFTSKLITTIGGMCYSLYLLHYPLIVFLLPYTLKIQLFDDIRWNLLVQMVILIPLIIVLVSLFFLAIERPCMRKDWPQQLYTKIKRLWQYDLL
jgi:peptidoglycan/LPS O-acetylase OafA/YrhL